MAEIDEAAVSRDRFAALPQTSGTCLGQSKEPGIYMTHNRLLSLAVSAAMGSVVFGLAGGQHAFAQVPTPTPAPLPPGTTTGPPVPIVVTGTPPFGGTLIQEIRSPLLGDNGTNFISGFATSAVFRASDGFLDFYYQFAFDNTTNVVVDTISLSSFTSVPGLAVAQTGEDVDGPGGLPAENQGNAIQNNFTLATVTGSYSSADRPNVNGNGINANLTTGVTRNETSFTFIVRTQARNFSTAGSVSVQGGGISAFTAAQGALSPLADPAPEPGALALLGLGLIAPAGGAIRRHLRRRS